LESIIEKNSEYQEMKDILSRYDTLAATNAELLERSREAQERAEKDRLEFTANTEVNNC
jgi:hypothetical protein